ncbi:MAG: TadE/TadG family type IV pilus assembly protein [Pseudomonadota bacterium]
MKYIYNIIRKIFNRQSGHASVEFALMSGLLILLFFGSVEYSRYLLIIQKVENVASTVADITTQTDPNTSPLTTSQMSQLMSAVDDLMSPYSSGANDPNIKVIVSSITKTGVVNPVINWQYCTSGGSYSATSRIGTTIGGTATLPNGFTMNSGEEIIIGEVIYNFIPMFPNNPVLRSSQIYRTSIYIPRLGALTAFSSTCP